MCTFKKNFLCICASAAAHQNKPDCSQFSPHYFLMPLCQRSLSKGDNRRPQNCVSVISPGARCAWCKPIKYMHASKYCKEIFSEPRWHCCASEPLDEIQFEKPKRSDLARCDVTTSKNAGLFFQYIQEALGFGRCIMQKERSNIIT